MRTRRGVSLLEVLVATLLLTVGVGGSVQALLTAGRLRARAAARERLARTVETRLHWFQARSCAAVDTTIDGTTADAVHEQWTVQRSGVLTRLEGRARIGGRADSLRLPLSQPRRCP